MGLFDVVGGILGTDKSGDAIASQEAAAAQSAAIQKQMYEQSRADLQPWREAGGRSLGKMEDADYQKDFSMADFQKDPGYDFRMQEGQKALERSAAARGGLMSGGTMKALTQYGQDFGANEYQNAYNRFNADRDRRFGRLSTLSSAGQNAASQTANSAMSYGQSMGNMYESMGNAKAGAYMHQGDQNAAMVNGIVQGAGKAGGFAAMFCDRRLKTDIEPIAKEDLAELKSCVKAYRFRYRDEKHGKGDFIGPMAQDLQRCKLGKDLVVKDHDGNLMLDVNRVLMLVLASMEEVA